MNESEGLVRAGYDAVYEALPRSPTFRRIWAEHACGTDYPDDFRHISFVTLAETRAIAEALGLSGGAVLVDLACGAGGPGLWIARELGATLIGVDLASVGLAHARERAERVGMTSATF